MPNSVIAAVIQRQGRYLVCQRPAHKKHGLFWEFPGGKIEPGETMLEAAVRELQEELALSVRQIGTVHLSIGDQASGYIVNFVDVEADGDPLLLEHLALQWLPPAALLEVNLAPTDKRFAQYLNQLI